MSSIAKLICNMDDSQFLLCNIGLGSNPPTPTPSTPSSYGHTYPWAPVCMLPQSRVNIARLYLCLESIRQSVSLFLSEREGKTEQQQWVLWFAVSVGHKVSSHCSNGQPGGVFHGAPEARLGQTDITEVLNAKSTHDSDLIHLLRH